MPIRGRRETQDLYVLAMRAASWRTMTIGPSDLLRGIRRWLAHGRPETGLVFRTPSGLPLDLDGLRANHFKTALTAAKIKRPLRIYDLRHGFATAALEAGADVRTVADLMGHSSTRTTQDIYQHVSDERKREAAARIASALVGGGSP